MNLWYLDTSAAFKLLFEEAETKALDKAILTHSPVLSSCRLLETELRRTRNKYPELSLGELESFLASITIFDLDRTVVPVAVSSLTVCSCHSRLRSSSLSCR